MNIIQIGIWLVLFVFVVRWIFAVVLSRRGGKLIQAGKLDRADALFSWMLKYYKRNPLILLNQTTIDNHREDYQSALIKYDKMILSGKGGKFFNTATYGLRGYLNLHLGRYTEARNDYQTAYEMQSKHNMPIYLSYWGIVASYFYQKDYISTLKETQQILPILEHELSQIESHGAYLITSNAKSDLRLKTIYLFINSFKARAFAYLGQVDDAKEVFIPLSEKFSDFAPFYFARAELMFVLGDYLSALSDYQKASPIFNDDNLKGLYTTISGYKFHHIVLAEYAVTLFACGEIEQAQAQWRELQAKAPLLTSAERVGKEFFWTEAMTAKAKELEVSLNM
ncbi:MAG: tetratricopeptide repeat protein [bacterium]|nr:tetratricopeptide repeat protein [bacterium]